MIKVTRNLPENFIAEHLPYFEHSLQISLPDPGYIYFTNKILILSNGIVINGLRVEQQSLLYATRYREIGGRLFLVKKMIKALLKNSISFLKVETDAVTIVNEWTSGYFHWFTEAVPKLIYMLQQGKKSIVLLPADYHSEYHLRSLELLGVSVEIYSAQIVRRRNVFLPYRLAPYSAHYDPLVMQQMALIMKANLKLDINRGKRVFISRRQAANRKLINEADVIILMKEFEFQVLEFEDYNFDAQVSMMHYTDILVSIHGGGLTNMIFCKPGTKILELSLKNQVMDKCYYNLANAMDLKYYYQFCDPENDVDAYFDANIIVSIPDLRNNLLLMTTNAAEEVY